MNDMANKPTEPKPRGRPHKAVPKLNATPEQIARAIFSAVKKPSPELRNTKVPPRAKK